MIETIRNTIQHQPIISFIVFLVAFYLLRKIWIRLQLSLAKHPSLSGHSKWSRRIAKYIPYFAYDEDHFFASDQAPEHIQALRKKGFDCVAKKLKEQYPKSIQVQNNLSAGVSDVQFTSAYRVPFPYRDYLQKHLTTATIVDASKGVQLKDIDGNWSYDLTGSYGVNVFGYDFYKECMEQAWQTIKELGPVLGTYHPIIEDNVKRLKKISGHDEVSFHMSGTEAVMQAVRLARYHTGKTHLVRLCGAYHGWWDGVQPGIGNQRDTNDVYTLQDMSQQTLRILNTRKDIACVLINPLQGLHPNADASSDASLVSSSRQAHFNKEAYTKWLHDIRKVCTKRNIVLIIDDVFTGFRLGHKGAQEFYKVKGDIVTYGKTLGGGMPIGVVCGKHHLMKRFKDDQPVNVSFARGTFNSHPYVMASMNAFLKKIEEKDIQTLYQQADDTWIQRFSQLNQQFEKYKLPIRIEHLLSIATIIYTKPSRYNWMYQYYLRSQGLSLSWVGSGRLIFSHNYTDEDFERVSQLMLSAAINMEKYGWWWQHKTLTNKSIARQMLKDMLIAKFPFLNSLFKPKQTSIPQPPIKELKNS